jgi:uncharacterized coiled-coil DUF342 family protein
MNNYFSIVVISLLLVNTALLCWMWYKYADLKRKQQMLFALMTQNSQDIAGLCSAAVNVDNHLSENDKQLKSLLETTVDYKKTEQVSQPYYDAIKKVKRGAGIDELMRECRLSRDEAALLIRLHGK